jgi:dTDP-glucose pyrophosphorylase
MASGGRMVLWRKCTVDIGKTLFDAIKVIDRDGAQIALVVDDRDVLRGTITDGDVRRAILSGCGMDTPVVQVMNPKPHTLVGDPERPLILETLKRYDIRHIPIIDESGRMLRLETLGENLEFSKYLNPVVLMAGGRGTRLTPLTENCPKPLLSVGDKPLLETTLQNFAAQGFGNFFISVNYKAEMIERHFGDGAKWGCSVNYLREDRPLGTAGAVAELQGFSFSDPVVVMNGDLLTKVNFPKLLQFHEEKQADVTMCVREYEHQVPYGVVSIKEGEVDQITEKPTQRHFVNAGIYILSPKVVRSIQRGIHLDMTKLIDGLLAGSGKVAAYPIREYWIDIGRLSDLERANHEFSDEFGN